MIYLENDNSCDNPPWRAGCRRTRQRPGKPENKVSEFFRYRNSPEGCETNRTIRCFIGERDGLGGFRLEGW